MNVALVKSKADLSSETINDDRVRYSSPVKIYHTSTCLNFEPATPRTLSKRFYTGFTIFILGEIENIARTIETVD